MILSKIASYSHGREEKKMTEGDAHFPLIYLMEQIPVNLVNIRYKILHGINLIELRRDQEIHLPFHNWPTNSQNHKHIKTISSPVPPVVTIIIFILISLEIVMKYIWMAWRISSEKKYNTMIGTSPQLLKMLFTFQRREKTTMSTNKSNY